MANNPYVNKVVYGNNTLIDISADTVAAEYLLEGYTAHGKDGSLITGTYIPEGGSAVVVTEEQDSHGGVIKHITAIDLSEDTIIAGALLTGYTAHDRQGHAITGTLAHGNVDTSNDNKRTLTGMRFAVNTMDASDYGTLEINAKGDYYVIKETNIDF